MTQELRNKIYGAVAGVLSILVIVGIVDQATSDEATTLLNLALETGSQVLGLVGTLIAFFKSLPSRVTTVEVPKADVVEVITVPGVPNVDADGNAVGAV